MKKFYLASTLVLSILLGISAHSQDFSNKGKDFWVAYGYHQIMTAGNAQNMVLYFATDQVTTVTVTIPGIGYSVTYPNIPANTVFASGAMPKGSPDARLLTESLSPENKGIHITSDKPIIAYAHIYNGSVSGATILFPTNTLGKEYYSVNFTNNSNSNNSNCWFYVIAADTGSTTVEITPSATTQYHAAGVPFQVTLTQGQVFNLMGQYNNGTLTGVDLTGSTIKSISNGPGGCKKIAVFSGSGRININCTGTPSSASSDNYMVQAVPKSAWGKKFLTVPSVNYGISNGGTFSALTVNYYRVCVSDPSTVVKINGVVTALPLINNFYYQISATAVPQLIEADKPIMVSQYFPSQAEATCGTPSGDGDPEVIYLSPVEQSINTVRWLACRPSAINPNKHYINVIIPNSGTAISSFKLDGAPVNPANFVAHPQDPKYAYAILNVTGSTTVPGVPHVVTSDSGFNAIAYGYGSAESYGYNAGTNVKDLYNEVGFITPWGDARIPAVCKGTESRFRISLPYQPDSMYWDFHGFQTPNVMVNAPPYPQVPDSTTLVNGKTVYWYSLPNPYIYPNPGVYPVTLTSYTQNADCGSQQDLDFNVTVYDMPTADFNFSTNGCVNNPVVFTDNSNGNGRPVNKWYWNFGDGNSATTQNTTHTYATAGSYSVKHSVITDIGCKADTVIKLVTLGPPPVPTLNGPASVCLNSTGNIYTTEAGKINYVWTVTGGTITAGGTSTSNTATVTWTGVGTQSISVTYADPSGCAAAAPTIFTVVVNPLPTPTLSGPTSVCLNSTGNVYTTQAGKSNYVWSVTGGTITAGGTSSSNTATVTWTTVGTQSISVNYADANGCTAAAATVYTVTVNPSPTPTINGPLSACLNAAGNVYTTEAGKTNYIWNVIGGTITAGGTSTSNTATVTWTSVGPQSISVNYTDANGCAAASATVFNVTVNPLPVPIINGPSIACLNATGNVYTTQAGMTNYVWAVVGGTITAGGTSTSNTATVTWTSTGAQSIRVSYTDANGCTAASATVFNVTVNALPTPTLSGPLTACLNSAGNVYTTQAGNINYSWTIVGGIITAGGTSTSNTATVTWTTPGTQTISVIYADPSGCAPTSPATFNVTVNPLPTPTLSGPTSVCQNSTGNVYSTQAGRTNYVWTIVGGIITAGGTATSNTATVTWTSTGVQSISVNYTDANGCTAASSTTFNVNVNALPTPAISGPVSVCLNSTGNVYTTQAGNSNYSWNVVGGIITAGGTATSNTATVTWTSAGAQSISVNYTDANGCTAAAATLFNVTVNPLPTPTLSGPTSACLNSTGNVYTTQAGMTNYIWNIVGGTITAGGNSTSNTATVTWTSTGTQTISVNYTDANGCSAATATVYNVTVGALPVATINASGPTTFCAGGSVLLTASAGTSWLWNTGATTQSITVNTSGSYSVTVTIGNGCSATSAPINVTVNPLPTPTLSGPASACLNSTGNVYTTQAGNSNYSWNVVGGIITAGGTATSNTATVTWTTTGAQSIRVNYTDANGCTAASATIFNVTVNPLPAPTLSGPTSACLNSTGNIYSTQAGNTNYTWNVVGGTITAGGNSTSNTATITWTSTGTQSVSVNYTDANGCSAATATIFNVTVNPLPTPSLNGPTSVCYNSTGNIYTTQAGKSNYIWTVVGGTITAGGNATSNTATVTWTNTGTQSISVNYTDANGCTAATATVFNVTVNALPTPTLSGPTSACLNSAGNIYTTQAGNTNYNWNVVGGTITAGGTSTSNTITITWTTVGTQSISINYTDANGCTAASPTVTNITVKPLPTASISGATEVCLNSTPPTITFTGANGTPPYTFTYTINGGPNQIITTTAGNSSVTLPVPTGTAGTYTYSLVNVTEGSANACTQNQSGSVTVVVNPLPTANFNTSVPSCETNDITFTDASLANAGNIIRWNWDFGDGGSAIRTNGNPFTYVYNTAQTYNATLTVETNKGCISTIFLKPVIVNVRPKANFTAPQICMFDPVAPFTDGSTITAGNITNWNWTFSDGGTSTQQNPSHPFSTPGTQSATLIVTSNQGCKDTISKSFVVNGTPTANFAVQNSNALCSNQVVNITDASSITSGNILRTEIYWDYNNDPTIKTVDNNPVIGTSYTHTYPEFGTPASKTVSIRYVTYSGITCLSSFTRNITLLATPTLQFNSVTPVCSNAPSFQITEAQILNGLPGVGVFSGTGVSPTGFFNTAAAGAGAHTIRYTYTATNGCSNFIEQVVNVYPTPSINAGPDKVVLEGGVVKLTPSLTIGGPPITFLWTPSTGLSDPTNPYTNASPPDDITYTLTVTSDKGCTASDQVFVKVLKAPVIPNIFSPNGDGVHDKWVISYLETYPGCTVDVYNRYGQLVYHSVGYSTPWDGTVNGKPVPVGTYYYIVNPKNGRKVMSGYVDIIR